LRKADTTTFPRRMLKGKREGNRRAQQKALAAVNHEGFC
jgi:hypothetical protein